MRNVFPIILLLLFSSCVQEDEATLSGQNEIVFLAAQVCSGETDGVTTGTAICQSASSSNEGSAGNLLSGKQLWNSSGTVTTGSMVSRGNWNLNNSFPGSGFYAGVTSLPASGSICPNASIMGVDGSATCGYIYNLHPSGMHHDVGVTQISITTEKTLGAALTTGYRIVPKIATDDDGFDASSPVIKASRPTNECGTPSSMSSNPADRDEANKISERIVDCLARNPTTATWDGGVKGNSSQVTWKLVTRSSTGKEVWVDTVTGFLWSDQISTTINWCEASGSSNASGVASTYRQDDPSDFCDNATYQDQTNPYSACTEFTGAQAVGTGDNYSSGSETYGEAKGGMGKASSATSPAVYWRLPTNIDFMLAEIHGIRFVIPGTNNGPLWSTTVGSSLPQNASRFDPTGGKISVTSRGTDSPVICIGRSNW